jgi:ataxia telangiectasia mutated family protein
MLSTLSKRPILQKLLNINAKDARHVEVNAAIVSSRINRAHGALQNSLRTATYLNGLVGPCNDLGLRVEAAARLEVANALWDQGESTTSIRMLQDLESLPSLNQQDIRIPKSTILAKLASQVSSARLEKPDRIIQKYLEPALAELKNRQQGEDAGKVYREFAVFCDRQYNDPDGVEDFARAKKLRDMKLQEIEQLEALQEKEASDLKNKVGAKAKSMPRRHESAIRKARQWLALDGKEFERLEAARMALLKQSIENYLLSLAAWDEEDSDALRFVALWLEHWDSLDANKSVESLLGLIPSYKFANLSNQLTSRLLNEEVLFQELLSSLVLRICRDHPYHSMHQVWTAQTAQPAIGDITAMSRQKAAERIALNLYEGQESGKLWASIDKVNKAYLTFAAEGTQGNEKYRTGQRLRVQNSPGATVLSKVMTKYLLPPLTYHIPLRSDKDYSRLPTMAKLDQHISIANGMSAPKVINIVASNGGVHKQLVSLHY